MSKADRHWYHRTPEDVLDELNTAVDSGLDSAEAAQRLQQQGPNTLPEGQQRGVASMLLDQFRDLMIQILLLAALVAAFVGEPQDAIAILVIVLLNAIIGVVQQHRAENAIAALRQLAAPHAQVLRDGTYLSIPAAELVPGDIVSLEAGAVVPADLRLLHAVQLQADESMLTGESQPVEKHCQPLAEKTLALGDRANMAFRSTLITRGRAQGVVVATGLDTEIGSIARLLRDTDPLDSPLQQRLTRFSKRLALLILAICAIIFTTGLLRGEPWLLMLLTSVSLAVAAIPEALPAVVGISLAMGAYRMSGRKALVRNLPAVETLGSVSFICSDKTGTLTMNRMNAELALSSVGSVDLLPHYTPELGQTWRLFGQCLAISNDVQLSAEQLPGGDPTEIALFEMAQVARFQKHLLTRELPRVAEIPFTSERKQMTTVHRAGEGVLVFSKGAPEVIIEGCAHLATDVGPSDLDAAHWQSEAERLSNLGYRVLALAYRHLDDVPADDVGLAEQNLILLGLVALIDPPREGALEAVRDCESAGITSVMITGDHPGTAREIARRLGIGPEGQKVITGAELDNTTDEQLMAQVMDNRVYARVSPAQKIRLVQALQAHDQFVAMTGDGVNDAPALRQADIGIAMGLKGTDVAREAAAMILPLLPIHIP